MRAPQAQPAAAVRRACHVRVRVAVASLLAVTAILALAAPSALAAPTRGLYTQLTGLTPPDAAVPGPFPAGGSGLTDVEIGPAGDIWASVRGRTVTPGLPAVPAVISTFDPLGGYLSQLTTFRPEQLREIALNNSTGYLYTGGTTGERPVLEIFDNTGSLVKTEAGFPGQGELQVAVDNSGGAGAPGEGEQGRVYVGGPPVRSPFETIEALTPNGEPQPLAGCATCSSYVEGNRITGTPTGHFGTVVSVATDSHGNVYVVDASAAAVDEFKPSGEFVRAYDGNGEVSFPTFVGGVAVDPTTGNVLIAEIGGVVDEFDQAGKFLGQITGPSETTPFNRLDGVGIDVNPEGFLYLVDQGAGTIDVFLPVGVIVPEATTGEATPIQRTAATLTAHVGLNGGSNLTSCRFEYVAAADYKPWEDHPYAAGPSAGSAPCLDGSNNVVGTPGEPITAATDVHAPIAGLVAATGYHYRVSVANAAHPGIVRNSSDRSFETLPAVTELKTLPATEITNLSATLNASFVGEEELATTYYFEYGTSTNYGHKSPVPAAVFPGTASGAGSHTQSVSAPTVSVLVPNTTYHYRVVAENSFGTTPGEDLTFTTNQPPTIESFSSSHVTATSADLAARINPQGFETECRFEYGPTTDYGASAPCPAQLSGTAGQGVEVHIEGLQSGVTYHFRVVAENKWGSVTSEDQSFEFFPPSCPNSGVRQQTGSAYLPDCRAYELVSPGNGNGTLYYSGGPNPGTATSPSRFAYVGAFSSPPGSPEVINTAGDLYVSTRTNSGWVSHYIGPPGDQAACVGGPPNSPASHTGALPSLIQNEVPTDPSMSRFLDFVDGTPIGCLTEGNGVQDGNWQVAPPSNAPFLWGSGGNLLGHLPSGLESTPGAAAALTCPVPGSGGHPVRCSSDVAASGDLTHLAFSSNQLAFAPGGLSVAPGSAYDDDIATGEINLISTLKQNGQPIPQDPAYAATSSSCTPTFETQNSAGTCPNEEFIRFPAVSADGSHVLMSTATAPTPDCQNYGINQGEICPRFTAFPIHLYMSIDDKPAVEVSRSEVSGEDLAVHYVGMTPDGSRVFFTSAEALVAGDRDTSADLYMWSQRGEEQGHPLTLISKGDNAGEPGEPGSTDACAPALEKKPVLNGLGLQEGHQISFEEVPWTAACGVSVPSTYAYSHLPGNLGGNVVSDSPIAANGDIYFYSPEQLDGDRGILGRHNLYDYREGAVHFVATFAPQVPPCSISRQMLWCAEGPIARFEVNADDTHAAFVTDARLTSYDNTAAGGVCQEFLNHENHETIHYTTGPECLEMYSYTTSSGAIVCDSCNPSGQPPSTDVYASQDGRFLTDDGRTFFSTAESLVPQDTNLGVDVYEFVDGRPQLITPGTGTAKKTAFFEALPELPGLIGVSSNGTDAYFATFDTLIPAEDHNGTFFRFYDARSAGGFLQPPPIQPCAAAEECHGPGTEAPQLPTQATVGELSGGNVTPKSHRRHKKTHRSKASHERRRHHAAKHGRGGAR